MPSVPSMDRGRAELTRWTGHGGATVKSHASHRFVLKTDQGIPGPPPWTSTLFLSARTIGLNWLSRLSDDVGDVPGQEGRRTRPAGPEVLRRAPDLAP